MTPNKDDIECLLLQIKSGEVSEEEIRKSISSIRQQIKEDASKGKELGELLNKINQAVKSKQQLYIVNWVKVENGFMAIGHKPGGKISFEGLKEEGTSTVLTLLQNNEGASLIGKRLQSLQINWIWFPFSASKPHDGKALVEVKNSYQELAKLLEAGDKIYIHCSAGIHRTGMITYGLLRFLGKDKTVAFELLRQMREVTANQVGTERLLWADQFAARQ